MNFVRSFFDGSEGRVFSDEEMKNKIDLYHLRAVRAQRAYHDYLASLKSDPVTGRSSPKRYTAAGIACTASVEGNYYIRDNNRRLALTHGLPVKYDRPSGVGREYLLEHFECLRPRGSFLSRRLSGKLKKYRFSDILLLNRIISLCRSFVRRLPAWTGH